jgi:hypothetical protein
MHLSTLTTKLRYFAHSASLGAAAIIPDFNQRPTQTCSASILGRIDDPETCVNTLTSSILNIFFAILTGTALILLVWAGIQYIQSQGSADGVKQARQRIINIFIAIIILVTAYTIISLILSAAGFVAGEVNR